MMTIILTKYNVTKDGLVLRSNHTETVSSFEEVVDKLKEENVQPPDWNFIPKDKVSYILEGETYRIGDSLVVAHVRIVNF